MDYIDLNCKVVVHPHGSEKWDEYRLVKVKTGSRADYFLLRQNDESIVVPVSFREGTAMVADISRQFPGYGVVGPVRRNYLDLILKIPETLFDATLKSYREIIVASRSNTYSLASADSGSRLYQHGWAHSWRHNVGLSDGRYALITIEGKFNPGIGFPFVLGGGR